MVFSLKEEIQALEKVTENLENLCMPFLVGLKFLIKSRLFKNFYQWLMLLVGGAMAYPFLKAKGFSVGKFLCSEEDKKLADMILSSQQKSKIVLPIDHIVADNPNGEAEYSSSLDINDDKWGLTLREHLPLLKKSPKRQRYFGTDQRA